jgi:glycosyltransferase involved in cell wall biosynthesis/2-polyprenyl-3-methyl-5-hydroxy-6-metoxy-1,4-benzoquinol methylase
MTNKHCWCANSQLEIFSSDYMLCVNCQTLISQQGLSTEEAQVKDDEKDFYGKQYWLSHQNKDLGFPDIYQRARADLPERCLYWLRAILKYKPPSAKVLELGSAHGGFVAMLNWAGYDATGLDLSPWAVEFARKTFQVPMLLGPVEEQSIVMSSLDVIVLMDVFEHLPDPQTTIQHCLKLLKPDGILIIQTPCYPENKTYEEMSASNDRFLEMLQAREHLYLFSRQAAQKFFQQIGADYIQFEPAIFSHYDMFLVVGRMPLKTHTEGQVENLLSSISSGRMVQALLDIDKTAKELERRLQESEADRAARLNMINKQGNQLSEVQWQVEQYNKLLQTSEADRAARLEVINIQENKLREMQARQAEFGKLSQEFGLDREMLLNVLKAQENKLTELYTQIIALNKTLQEAIFNRNVLLDEMGKQKERVNKLTIDKDAIALLLTALKDSRGYKLLRKLGFWKPLSQSIDSVISRAGSPEKPSLAITAGKNSKAQLNRIAVDLTPLAPGGENGGAKLMTIELIQHMSKLAPEIEFVLLTPARCHEELIFLDSANVRRLCVVGKSDGDMPVLLLDLKHSFKQWLKSKLPSWLKARLTYQFQKIKAQLKTNNLLKELKADLLFCPFTAPFFFEPTVPVVSVIYDLQYRYYPQFFNEGELYHRDKHFVDACRLANRLICISNYVCGTVLENSAVDPKQVKTVHIRLSSRLERPSAEKIATILSNFDLQAERFIFYPANFWQHKNHTILLTAFSLYKTQYPTSELKLVCTGAPNKRMEYLQMAVNKMALGDSVMFLGYLHNEELAGLMASCRALIFPSLYEGFGMPVLEAMAFGKPVLCSNVTSLPEVAESAALFFDPKKPQEITLAINRIESEPELVAELIRCGQERYKIFSDSHVMAMQYLQNFREVMSEQKEFTQALHGIYPDGWISNRAVITYESSTEQRVLEMELTTPKWLPVQQVHARIFENSGNLLDSHRMMPGQSIKISYSLAAQSGFIEILLDPLFQPKKHGMGEDERLLSCVCQSCRIVSPRGIFELFGQG